MGEVETPQPHQLQMGFNLPDASLPYSNNNSYPLNLMLTSPQPQPLVDPSNLVTFSAGSYPQSPMFSSLFMVATHNTTEADSEVQTQLNTHTPLADGVLMQGNSIDPWTSGVPAALYESDPPAVDPMVTLVQCQNCGQGVWGWCFQCFPVGGLNQDPLIYGNSMHGGSKYPP